MSRALPVPLYPMLLLLLPLAGCHRTTTLGKSDGGDGGNPSGPSASVSGRVCTAAVDPASFPVRVVLLLDQSGSMCVTDPGGSADGGFCALFSDGGTPARARAVEALAAQLGPSDALAVLPFELNAHQAWPAGGGFAHPDPSLSSYLDTLDDTLGAGADFQGALDLAYAVVADDVARLERNNPEILPRTRYLVLLVTDGVPSPRCSFDDTLTSWASGADPSLIWADSDPSFCNDELDGGATINGFTPGSDRNQNAQLSARLDALLALQPAHHLGDVRFHEVLLFNDANAAACGPLCDDVYGADPSVPPAQYVAAAHASARWLGQHLALEGHGNFQEFENGAIDGFGFDSFDLRSLSSNGVLAQLFPQPLSAVLRADAFESDVDGDGLTDAEEMAMMSNPFEADTDGDGFDDHYEATHTDHGFDPLVPDARGCDPTSPFTPGCVSRDTDGDGLSQFAEAYLGTQGTSVDTDLDGIPDGLEVRSGLDPTVPNTGDTDGDGAGDLTEVERGTNPLLRDPGAADRAAFVISSTAEATGPGGVTCYDFTLSHLPLLDTPAAAGRPQGFNLYQLWFTEAPARAPLSLTTRTACVAVRFNGDHAVEAPQVPDTAFDQPYLVDDPAQWPTRCVGWSGAGGP